MSHSAGRWKGRLYIVGDSIVGTVERLGCKWFACGCQDDWEDTPLGTYGTELEAERSVEEWVTKMDAEIPERGDG